MSDEDRRLLITGARVYTADPRRPWAGALVTQGGLIAFVGSEEEAHSFSGPHTERIHLPGGLVVPGLNDSHIHMSWGASTLDMLDLEDVRDVPELQQRLRSYAAAHPDRPWLEGFGLPYDVFLGADQPERSLLDAAISDRPLYVRASDWHSSWSNTSALDRAGILHGASLPSPNAVVVDPATGLATGLLKEKLAQECVERLIPVPAVEEQDAALARAMRYVNSLGITSVQNMDGDAARPAQYARLYERGSLSVRAAHYLNVRAETPRERLHEFAALASAYADPWNRVRGIKLFFDGVVEGKTALMLEPYADGSGETGLPNIEPEVYREIVLAADSLRLNVATHAIGDRAVRLVLDAYGAARQAGGARAERRPRVEHIEVAHPSDVTRFAALGVTASMQPLHAILGDDPRTTFWTGLVGPDREAHAFPWRGLLDSGAPLAFGSDWPIVTPDPRLGLYAAVARRSISGRPEGGWHPEQRLSLAQAIDAYTRGAAYAEGQERVKGMLCAGMLADITVFAQDLFALPPAEILTTEVALTVVDGRVVYRGGGRKAEGER